MNLEKEVLAGLRQAADSRSIRAIAKDSGVSHTTLYRMLDPDDDYRPNKATLMALSAYLKRAGIKYHGGTNVTHRVGEEPYAPGPLVAKLGTRAREIVLQYLRRLEAAGLDPEKLAQMEHLLADRSYAQRLSMLRRGIELSEDDQIILIEDTWRTISDTLALSGIRP